MRFFNSVFFIKQLLCVPFDKSRRDLVFFEYSRNDCIRVRNRLTGELRLVETS
jgi:hypothetical protein